MFGFDLSSNRFSGEIPLSMRNLNKEFDLSYNNLNGVIPPQLTVHDTLAVFSVAYNNLSRKTPEMKAQFGTFDERSYEGNPLLCGAPLQNYYCSEEESPSQPVPNDEQEDDGFINMNVFYVSFGPVELCYANKKAFPFCDPILYDPFGVVKALRIHVLLME
ncbi:hypothetical protein POTOM_018380 [Populus tomentosa]|uniref:Uncharacterized protein n=1 Tax=Populus tomentosa TaxID=118781 RepID=A0A8X7ZVG2_POPTO|nr:hypothetical protein POTOM_018380 [Populus tomentosa]